MPTDFPKEWKGIKAEYEISTKKKKPTEKFLGLFRKSSGLETAFASLDRAIDKDDLADARKAIKEVKKSADAYQGTLIKAAREEKDKEIQKDTSNMMVRLHKLVEQAEGAATDVGKISRMKNLSDFVALMKSKNGDRFAAAAKSEFNYEAILFLNAMVKKDYSSDTYEEFIKENGNHQVNIPGPLRVKFDELDPKEMKKAPWADAVHEILTLLNDDVVPRTNANARAGK